MSNDTDNNNTTGADTPSSTDLLLAGLDTATFTLSGGGEAPDFDVDQYLNDCIQKLDTCVMHTLYGETYSFDGGALGELEIELDDHETELDLCELVSENWCGSAPDTDGYMSGESGGEVETSLADVRGAWIDAASGSDKGDTRLYLLAVISEALAAEREATMQQALATARERVSDEMPASSPAPVADDDAAKALRGSAEWLRTNLQWAAGVLAAVQPSEAVTERAKAVLARLEATESWERFQAANAGKGYSASQMADMYQTESATDTETTGGE
jgi:hypothetical protein